MRTLTWLVGVLVILLGFASVQARPGGWTAVWISAAVLWFFVGTGFAVAFLSRLVTARMGAGLNAASGQRPREVPAPQVKHGT